VSIEILNVDNIDEAIEIANDSEYGLTSSIYTNGIRTAMKACNELTFGETYINRENFEAMQGFHAGNRKSGIGGADGKHGLLNIRPRISATFGPKTLVLSQDELKYLRLVTSACVAPCPTSIFQFQLCLE
jgi:acyl-CoA reductase-like NAD-dependent aldehyde dehydrogenase